MAPGWYAQREELWRHSKPVSEWLVRKLDPQPGQTLLELAAGAGETGLLAAPLLGTTGRLISTDFAPEMVAAARQRAAELGISNVEFRVLDAQQMELESSSVDGVLCRWGYMLMVDPAAAFAETRRVLRPGGRLAFSVFAAPERNPWSGLVLRMLVSQGHIVPPDPQAPGIFALADPQRIQQLVGQAGFTQVEVEELAWRWGFADQEAYWRFLTEVAGGLAPILRSLPPAAQADVRRQVPELAAPFQAGAGYDFPAVVLNVHAR